MRKQQNTFFTTPRLTGIWYLIMAIAGILGFMVFHPQIYISDNPAKTLINLTDHHTLAQARLLFEFTIIVSQALTAVWFYKLFKNINEINAWSIGIWGTINSAVIMISAISMASALDVANSAMTHENKMMLVELLLKLISNAWGIGSLFFGLWLIPMGYVVVSSGRMPIWLGHVLIIGGIGYILNTFIKYLGVTSAWVDAFVIPATIGEFWMIGYLLIFGIRAPDK